MITVKEAVESAVSFFKEVSTTAPRGLRVEEVMLSDNEEYWLITLGLLGDELILKPGHTEDVPGALPQERSLSASPVRKRVQAFQSPQGRRLG
jgi:hypothetical protein